MPAHLKPQELRQRRNRVVSKDTLPADGHVAAPPLPKREGGWHEESKRFWASTWASPMAIKFLEADMPRLYLALELTEQFWRKPSAHVAKEIRQTLQAFGLTPLDRNRLQWKVEPKAETPKPEKKARRDFDPSKVLEMPRKK